MPAGRSAPLHHRRPRRLHRPLHAQRGIKNGQLLALAATNGFDAFITTDHAIEREQNPSTLPLAVVILDAMSNDEDDLLPLVPELLKLLNHLTPRAFTHVSHGSSLNPEPSPS